MRKIRLPASAYTSTSVWHLILHAEGREEPFRASAVVEACLEALKLSAAKYRMSVHVYCFMPDHLHILLANEKSEDVVQFVRHFKQVSGFEYRRGNGRKLWQDRFYDRAVRRDADVQEVANYIWDNPVQAGLIHGDEEYLYMGSLVPG